MLDCCIIGAPKSGTSSLFYWLDVNEKLEGATPKETYFFMDSEHPLCGRHGCSYNNDGIGAYKVFFPGASPGRRRFEGSVHYFYQTTARDYLTSQEPQPLIVMLLREPARRILSSFRFTRDNIANCDQSLTFDQYVECLLNGDKHELDEYFFSKGSLYIAKRELELSRYVEWLDWWLERLARERLELILFDELKNDPGAVMKRLCSRLGINAECYDNFDFQKKNATYSVGKQGIHRLARRVGSRVPAGRVKQLIKTKYMGWQQAKAEPDDNYQEGLQALREYFAPYNRQLNEKYGLELEKWWGADALGLSRTTKVIT